VIRVLLLHTGLTRGENHGVFVRHIEPLRWLFADDPEWNIVAIDTLHPSFPDAALTADLVIIAMTAMPEIESVIRLRRDNDLPTIFEITDNFLGVGDWVSRANPLHSPLVRQNILFYAAECDAVHVYAPAQAELVRTVNPRTAVLHPYVPIAELPEKPEGFVFGWGGTRSHREDLVPIAPVIRDFCSRHRDAIFAFMGDQGLFDELFAEIPEHQTRRRPYGTFEQYLEFVRGLHVGLAPLGPSPFNAGRGDTKFGIYAACGAAALLQDAPVYRPHAARARLFATPEDLRRHLDEAYGDREALTAMARRAIGGRHGREVGRRSAATASGCIGRSFAPTPAVMRSPCPTARASASGSPPWALARNGNGWPAAPSCCASARGTRKRNGCTRARWKRSGVTPRRSRTRTPSTRIPCMRTSSRSCRRVSPAACVPTRRRTMPRASGHPFGASASIRDERRIRSASIAPSCGSSRTTSSLSPPSSV
jgi:hypothetical protein